LCLAASKDKALAQTASSSLSSRLAGHAADSPSDVSSNEDAWAPLVRLRTQRRFREALAELNNAAREVEQGSPLAAEVFWRQALVWTDLGKTADNRRKTVAFYKQAVARADAALAADSTNAWAHLMKALAEGRLCLHVGSDERIERSRAVRMHAERALALDSTLATAYHIRGCWYRSVADLNLLERTVVRAVYGGLPEATFEQSVRDLKRALSMESRSYHHVELAKTYVAMGEEEKARTHLQAALESSGSPLDPEYKEEARSLLQDLD
jgi:FimV-like protein